MFLPLLAIALAAAPLPDRVLPATLRVERLKNGLTVVLAPYPAHGVVAFDTLVEVGSRDERGGPTGVAHLLEHLLFRQSAALPAGAMEQRLQRLGADANAETDADATLFADVAPRESLGELIDLEAARLQQPVLDDASVSAEAGAIRSEAQARAADAEVRLLQAVDRAAFPDHPYGHPVIGEPADLARLRELTQAARELYRRAYRPEQTVLVVSGDFEPERALARIRRAYGRWKVRAVAATSVPPRGASVPLAQSSAAEPEVAIAFRGPPPRSEREAAALQVLAELLGGPTSPLRAELVQERELAEQVDVAAVRRRDAVLLLFSLGASKPGELDALQGALESELRRLRAGQLDAARLADARAALLNRAAGHLEAPGVLARALALEAATSGRADGLERLYAELSSVTAAEVLAAARERLVPEARVTVALGAKAAAR